MHGDVRPLNHVYNEHLGPATATGGDALSKSLRGISRLYGKVKFEERVNKTIGLLTRKPRRFVIQLAACNP